MVSHFSSITLFIYVSLPTQVAPSLLDAVCTHSTQCASSSPAPEAAPETAEDAEEAPLPPLPLVSALGCLAAAFSHCSQPLGPAPPAVKASESRMDVRATSAATAQGACQTESGSGRIDSSRGGELVACTARVLSMPLPWQQVWCLSVCLGGGEGCRGVSMCGYS